VSNKILGISKKHLKKSLADASSPDQKIQLGHDSKTPRQEDPFSVYELITFMDFIKVYEELLIVITFTDFHLERRF